MRSVALLAVAFAAACGKPREETPAPPGAHAPLIGSATPQAAGTPILITEAALAVPLPTELDPHAPSSARLIAAYVAATEPHARVEIIHELAEAGAPGLTALRQVFQLETNSALKSAVLE